MDNSRKYKETKEGMHKWEKKCNFCLLVTLKIQTQGKEDDTVH